MQYKAKADRLNQSFHRQFYNAKTGVYAKGSQTSQALPLALRADARPTRFRKSGSALSKRSMRGKTI